MTESQLSKYREVLTKCNKNQYSRQGLFIMISMISESLTLFENSINSVSGVLFPLVVLRVSLKITSKSTIQNTRLYSPANSITFSN